MVTIDDAEKAKADAKAAVRFLKDRARSLNDMMVKNFASGNFTLASSDAQQLVSVLHVLGQIDLAS